MHFTHVALQAGECRRFPPSVAFLPTANGQIIRATGFPERKPSDPKCGEYHPKFMFTEKP